MNAISREPIPASELKVALECGGSDGFSGITANPALGVASDLLVGLGGTAILAETPEIYGAEQLLLRRAVSQEVADKLIERIRWWERYTELNGGSMDNNPSPGNKAGGLTTILEKSLGAAAKGGATPLTDVFQYAEQVTTHGFVFMDTPGYDPVATTGQIAGGAQVVVFTTGRGSAFGSKPAPTIKVATNDRLYAQMPDDMDINCGDIVSQGVTIQEKGAEILETILARRLRREDQERGARPRRQRVRPLAGRRGDVAPHRSLTRTALSIPGKSNKVSRPTAGRNRAAWATPSPSRSRKAARARPRCSRIWPRPGRRRGAGSR